VKIRAAESADHAQWLALWAGYNSFYKRTIPEEVTQKTWSRFFETQEPVFALVAEVDGKVCGFTSYLFHRHTALINDVCYLQDLYTAPEVRGRGVGKALIQAVYQQAKARGSLKVYWMTHESNETARALYDKLAKNYGFIVYSSGV